MRHCVSRKVALINSYKAGYITDDGIMAQGYTMIEFRKAMFRYQYFGRRGLQVTRTKWVEKQIDKLIDRRSHDMEALWREKALYA